MASIFFFFFLWNLFLMYPPKLLSLGTLYILSCEPKENAGSRWQGVKAEDSTTGAGPHNLTPHWPSEDPQSAHQCNRQQAIGKECVVCGVNYFFYFVWAEWTTSKGCNWEGALWISFDQQKSRISILVYIPYCQKLEGADGRISRENIIRMVTVSFHI